MSRRKRSPPTSEPSPLRRVRRIAIGGLAVSAVGALLLFGRGPLAEWSRQTAARNMEAGAISDAQQWLKWCAWLQPGDATTDLMRARCFRHLNEMDRWKIALESARQKGAPPTRILQELTLTSLQTGWLKDGARSQLGVLKEAGVSSNELAAALMHGFLRVEEFEKAKKTLDNWAAISPGDPHVAYMRGIYLHLRTEIAQAQAEFEKALAREPRHELARLGLAGLFEQQNRLDEAFEQYAELASRSPGSENAKTGLARVLLERGCIDEARKVLESSASRPEPVLAVVATMGEIELASGNHGEARRWFEQMDLDQTEDSKVLSSAAITFALMGEMARAERMQARHSALINRNVKNYNLQVRLALDPNDREASEALRRLYAQPLLPPDDVGTTGAGQTREDGHEGPAQSAAELYALDCSVCHGDNGDGNGRAARDLFPKPRDLRTGKSRLVSTRNTVPTLEDLETVILRGMPGVSMPPFDDLSEDQRKLLAQEVLRLNREGVRDQFIDTLVDAGEPIDESDVQQVVDLCTTPGDLAKVPRIGHADAQAIARGRGVYFDLGCQNCHGDDGTGDTDTPLFDEKGRASLPRDLIRDPFKGGDEPESIYLRIFAGMPGTSHPACCNVPEQQLIDLVHYCRSLSREPKRMLTNHQRAIHAMGGPNLFVRDGSATR